MATMDEVRAELIGPGGAFEVITDTIGGQTMKVYKDRLPHLRSVAEISIGRGDGDPFLVYGDRRIGFTEFLSAANSVSHTLAERGVQKGDRVAVLSANNPEWCQAFWGTVDMGAVLVGLNGWWKTEEIVYGLHDSGARVLVADRRRYERIAEHLDELPELQAIYLADADPSDFPDDGRLHRFDELTQAPTDRFPEVAIDELDPAVIFYTSGTTGKPKGAISSHMGMVANLQNTMFNAIAGSMAGGGGALPGGDGQNVSLFTSPLFHVSGCHSTLVVGLLAGLRLVMLDSKFEPDKALKLIEDEGVKVWATVPTMVWRVCEYPGRYDYDTSTVESVAFGGSPSADELIRKIRDTFPNVKVTTNAYGLTESSSVATVLSGPDADRKPDSVGTPMPVVDLKIADEAGTALPAGETGEVCIAGPIVMPGYWNKPEATAETIRDGWLHTGDVGHIDDEGYLFITDRKKDMIIRGGENVYCVEIEQRLVDHPDIADAAVIGVPHHQLGEEVKAVIQVEPGKELTEGAVQAWVAETLANFKVPAYVEIRHENLPRNASGKLLKNALRGTGEVSFTETM